MKQKRAALEQSHPYLNHTVDEIQTVVMSFLRVFDRTFEEMALPDKKATLRRMIETILVDRNAGKVRCYFKKLPSLDQLGGIYAADKNSILGQARSLNGNRTRI